MNEYPKEIIEGVSPLIFAVDAVLSPNSNEDGSDDLPFAIQGQRSTAFETFYNFIESRKEKSTSSENTQVKSPLLSSDPWAVFRKKYKQTSSDTFLQHARVVPVSHRHAFPPSKDPDGTHNHASKLNSALYAMKRTAASMNPSSILMKDPIQGILAEGWIEKHSHALPSTIILVTYIDLNSSTLYEQARLEQHLKSTIDSLSESCAKKRDVPILIAVVVKQRGVVATPKEMTVDTDRINSIRASCGMNHGQVIPIHCHDEKNATIYSEVDYHRLQKSVQDSSMLYYLTQVRRCKRKYASLHHDQIFDLLPFAARYSIKIAVFYEFQAHVDDERGGKSIKYWNEAYRYVQQYFLHLQGKYKGTEDPLIGLTNTGDSKADEHVSPMPTTKTSLSSDQGEINEEDTKVEVSKGQIPEIIVNVSSDEYDRAEDNVHQSSPTSPSSIQSSNSVEVALIEESSLDENGILGVHKKSQNDTASKIDDNKVDIRNLQTLAFKQDEKDNLLMCHSDDMIHQCRSVADWVNMKIILNAHVSATKYTDDIELNQKNFTHIVNQMRTHSAVFMKKVKEEKESNRNYPTWYFMKFVARQRLVVAQFSEHHPPPEGAFISNNVEIRSYFDTCNHYISAGDAYLQYESVLKNSKSVNTELNHVGACDERQRYVGGLGSHELESILKEECQYDHLAAALDCYSRALRFSKMNDRKHEHASKARVLYSMAKICIRNDDYENAARNIDSVYHIVQPFPLICIAFHRTLSKCIGRFRDGNKLIKTLALRIIMDSRVNKHLSPAEILDLQETAFSDETDLSLEWPINDEEGKPIYFSLTFPDRTYCTEGDKVPFTLHLCSTLPFIITVSKIHIETNIGYVQLHHNNQEMTISLRPFANSKIQGDLSIPHGCLKMADSTLLENQSYQGDKPRTSGLTAVGGGVLCPINENEKFSGGLCVACLGLTLYMTIPSNGNNVKNIVLKLLNHERGSFSTLEHKQLNQFTREEDNFLVSSWNRPNLFPIGFGPRCLRVINSQADLQIAELTSLATGGKLLEGTVNRMLLRLNTGKMERCADAKMRVHCKSFYQTKDCDNSDNHHAKLFDVDRPPLIVTLTEFDEKSDFVLPGWSSACDIESSNANGKWSHVSDLIDNDTEIFTYFDLFRPLSTDGSIEENTCHTEFQVTISYKKINVVNDAEGAIVEQQYHGSVFWVDPINMDIDILPRHDICTPSGSRHPTNMITSEARSIDKHALVSGRDVAISCRISATDTRPELGVEINEVSFDEVTVEESRKNCKIELVNAVDKRTDNNILYLQKDSDSQKCLTNGPNLQIGYVVKPSMILKDDNSPRVASLPLGALEVKFLPNGVYNESYLVLQSKMDVFSSYYGPLPIKNLPPYRRSGPICYIEDTPFEVSVETIPVMPKVGVPFETCYNILNKTMFQQKLSVSMIENEGSVSGILVAGYINADIVLGPNENRVLRYSLLATKIGKISPPILNISSVRNNTWIIRESNQAGIYIMP